MPNSPTLALAITVSGFLAIQDVIPSNVTPQRDSQGVSILNASTKASGEDGTHDVVAIGTITMSDGPDARVGKVVLRFRGTSQTKEEEQFASGNRTLIYSGTEGAQIANSAFTLLSVELALSGRGQDMPGQIVSEAVMNPDYLVQAIGSELIDGVLCFHVRVQNSFASRNEMKEYAAVSRKDIWIDQSTWLVRRISYETRAASGAAPALPVEVSYSDYRNVGHMFMPFKITELRNGMPWSVISIDQETVDNGLTDADFPVTSGAAQ